MERYLVGGPIQNVRVSLMRGRKLCVAIIVVLWSAVLLQACHPPGEGPRADAGYKKSEEIIKAIDSYRAVSGRYPTQLSDLVPRFLSTNDLTLRAAENSEYPFKYIVSETGYELTFRYSGPGVNDCTYSSATKKWSCRGRY